MRGFMSTIDKTHSLSSFWLLKNGWEDLSAAFPSEPNKSGFNIGFQQEIKRQTTKRLKVPLFKDTHMSTMNQLPSATVQHPQAVHAKDGPRPAQGRQISWWASGVKAYLTICSRLNTYIYMSICVYISLYTYYLYVGGILFRLASKASQKENPDFGQILTHP